MGKGIDLLEVKFKKEKDLNFFYDFFNKLSLGQLPELNETNAEYLPFAYQKKILTFLGNAWGFISDAPEVEKLIIDEEKLILKLTISGTYDGWATLHLVKCMLKRIEISESTHYGTDTSTHGTDLNWIRDNEEFIFSYGGIIDEFYYELGEDNFTNENYFQLLYNGIESGKIKGEKFQTKNVEQIDDIKSIKVEEYDLMLKNLVNYLRRMKEEPSDEEKIHLKFFKGNLEENIIKLIS